MVFVVILVASLSGGAAPAQAQVIDRTVGEVADALQDVFDLRPQDTTNWHLGLGPYVAPAFEGAKEYKINPAPVVSVIYRDVLRVDNNDIDFTAFDHVFDFGDDSAPGRFDVGPEVNFDFGRHESDSPALRGLGDIGFSIEAGAYISFKVGSAGVSLEATQDILASGHKGATADLQTKFPLYQNGKFSAGGSVTLTWATARYMKSFFGITGTQAAASGLPAFRAGSGIKDAALLGHATYQFTRHWSVVTTLGYKRLMGDAAASPLVKLRGSPDQFNGGLYGVYSF